MKRQTAHTRKINRLRAELEQQLSAAIYRELRWLWRQLYPRIRELRLKRDHIQKLNFNKLGITGELWEQFQQRLETSLDEMILAGAVVLAGEEATYWQGRGYSDFSLNPMAVVERYKAQIGRQITQVNDRIRQEMGQAVADWYNTPGATVQSLVENLQQYVSGSRAANIATTAGTDLISTITRETMITLGFETWAWNTMRDELCCTKPLKARTDGLGQNGCRGLHGKIFTLNDPMPGSKGSHIGCRCNPIARAR